MELLPKLNEAEQLALRKYRVWIKPFEDRLRELTPQQREYYQDLLVRDWYYDLDQRRARHEKLKSAKLLAKLNVAS